MICLTVGAKVESRIVEENKLNKDDNKQKPDDGFFCDEILGGAMVASLFQSGASCGDSSKMLEVRASCWDTCTEKIQVNPVNTGKSSALSNIIKTVSRIKTGM